MAAFVLIDIKDKVQSDQGRIQTRTISLGKSIHFET